MHSTARIALICAASAFAGQALAQDAVADFYKGKTLTIVAGSSAGGGLDTYARLVGRHISKFIPGNPNIVVQNMPGAGSLVAAKHLYAKGAKDGTQMAIVLPGSIFYALLKDENRAVYDPTRFNYIGNGNSETVVCIVRKDAPVKDFKEVLDKELVVGGTGPGSTMVDFPNVERSMLNAKIKLVTGYKGSRQVSLAVTRGEVHGACGLAWSSAKQQYPGVENGTGDFRVLVQEATESHPQLKGRAPLSVEIAKTPEQKKALEIFYAQGVITRPFIMPPGVPEERVAAIRKAFMETMKSKELQADAAKQKTDAVAQDGAFVEKLVKEIYASDKKLVDMLKKAIDGK